LNQPPIIVAMTGASGACYGLRLLECLVKAGRRIYFMISQPAQWVVHTETDWQLPVKAPAMQLWLSERLHAADDQIHVFGNEQWSAPIASGSHLARSMVVCPCTAGSLSSIAQGSSRNLMERAADVMLKEQRQLILVLRETPLSVIHLQHMLSLARLGVVIMPASPGFYQGATELNDIVDFMVARILDHLHVEHDLQPRWGMSL